MLAIKIDDPEIENRLKKYASDHKKAFEELASDALRMFLDMNKKDGELIYTKKDPMKHLHTIKYSYDDGEDLTDVKLYSHVDDVAGYVRDLRRVKGK